MASGWGTWGSSQNIEITGLKELNDVLKSLPEKIEKNVMRGALRAGQKVMLDGAKAKVGSVTKKDTGLLEKSLRIRFNRKSGKFNWIRSYLIAGDKDAYYSHMVEFGTVAHWITIKKEARLSRMTRRGPKKYGISTHNEMLKNGSLVIGKNFVGASVAHPGSKEKPFMRRTFDSYSNAAMSASVEYLRKRIPKELKKASK